MEPSENELQPIEEPVEGTRQELTVGRDIVQTVPQLRFLIPSSLNRAVIVLGAAAQADGGGGLFVWDPADNQPDDGFRVIKPNSVAGAGRYLRHIDGRVVSCRWFGANGGDPTKDDSVGINTALSYLAQFDGGGTLLIPNGAFYTHNPVVIPHWFSRPIRIVGLGYALSSLRGWNALAAGVPVMTVSAPNQPGLGQLNGFALSGLGISRKTPGPTFQYAPITSGEPTDADVVANRFEYCTLRDLAFQSPSPFAQVPGNIYPNLYIQFAGNSTFEDIVVGGGESAFKMVLARRCTLRNVRYTFDKASKNALVFERCGDLTLVNTRIEATDDGAGLKLDRCSYITVESLSFEGKRTNPQIWVLDSSFVQFVNAGGSSRLGADIATVRISGFSCAVRFTGGVVFGASAPTSGSHSIVVEKNARDVTFDGVGIAMFDGSDGNVASELVIEEGARRVHLGLLFTNLPGLPTGGLQTQNRYIVKSRPPTITASASLSVRDADEFFVEGSSTITELAGGYPGQRLTLFFASAGCSVSGPSIRLTSAFASNVDSVLVLVFDGARWTEVGRFACPLPVAARQPSALGSPTAVGSGSRFATTV
jgi:hypothetical protein